MTPSTAAIVAATSSLPSITADVQHYMFPSTHKQVAFTTGDDLPSFIHHKQAIEKVRPIMVQYLRTRKLQVMVRT